MGMGPAPMRSHSSTTSTKADEFRRVEVITGVGRRRRWTDEEKAWIVAESLDPATTVPAAHEAPEFMPVVVAEDAAAPAEMMGRMEIALGPTVVRVGADVDAAAL